MDPEFINQIYNTHKECTQCPSSSSIKRFYIDLMGVLFPDFAKAPVHSEEEFNERIEDLKVSMKKILYGNLSDLDASVDDMISLFFEYIPELYSTLQLDIDATYAGDPAAKSREEVIRSYPGFYAISAYRVANRLTSIGVKNVPRVITEHAHGKTGIDIHPNAEIGKHFCIDHGTGVVIGETTIIGDHVKIYQGVTLGALSVNKEDAKIKRHPTIEDNVVLYAGATILGGNTVVGKNSIIGGNVWLTKSVPAESKIYYQAQMHNDEGDRADMIVFK